jgi:hypothetical protein
MKRALYSEQTDFFREEKNRGKKVKNLIPVNKEKTPSECIS